MIDARKEMEKCFVTGAGDVFNCITSSEGTKGKIETRNVNQESS